MHLGSIHGASIEFSDHRIAALRFERAKLRIGLGEKFEPEGTVEAPSAHGQRLDAQPEDFAAPLTETAFARQRVAGGWREITISNRLATTLSMSPTQVERTISSEVRFVFDLTKPTRWTLQLLHPATITQPEPQSLRILVNKAVWMNWLAAGARLQASTATSWSVELATGYTEVTLDLHVGGWRDVSDTVVVCRPDQLREAAIALAAIPDRRFVPLLVLEPAPMALGEVRAIFRNFRDNVDERLGQFGAFSRAEFAHKTEQERLQFLQDWAQNRRLQQQMHPYRSWTKRNTMLRRALVDFDVKKAICLFDPAPADLVLTGVEYQAEEQQIASDDLARVHGLLDGLERVVLQSALRGQSLDAVFDECRSVISGSAGLPVFEIEGDPGSVILGLCDARRTGRALRVRPEHTETHAPIIRSYGEAAGDHVVAVEVEDRASTLIASLFAAHLGTTLLTLPRPDLVETERLVSELQQAVVEQARQATPANVDDEDTKRLFNKLSAAFKQHVLGDRRPALLGQLEQEVTRQVPAEFVSAVAARALTVFGSGLPYGFVKRGETDWTTKRIGHVISDPDLIVISEVHNAGAIARIVAFNIVFDPGFFQRSETEMVAEALKARSAKTLVLRENVPIAFLCLVECAPLEFIFFNTHGTDDAILLGDYPLQDYQITQWFRFDQRPLIFNNSCLSWTGVGRDFVRIGARGYVGTLWSVGAHAAAQLAEQSMARMIDAGEPICGAIRQPDIDPFTSRAYVFVGAATASFPMDEQEEAGEDPVRLVALMQNYERLLHEMRSRWVADNAPNALVPQLYAEFKALREGLADRNEDYLKSVLADSLLAELNLLSYKDDLLNASLEYQQELIERSMRLVAEAPFDEAPRRQRTAELLFRRAEVQRLSGKFADADGDAEAAIETVGAASVTGRWALQTRIQIAIDQMRVDEALDLLKRADGLLTAANGAQGGDRSYELATLGRLCQALKRDAARLDEAMQVARKGVSVASSSDNFREEACFELDLAQIHQLKGEPREALRAAQRSLAKGRRARHAISELAAYGVIGQCYAALDDMANAREYSMLGLARARVLGERSRVIAFLNDLANIELKAGNLRESISYRIDGIQTAAGPATMDIWEAGVAVAIRTCARSGAADECGRVLSVAIGSLGTMPGDDAVNRAGAALLRLLSEVLAAAWPAGGRDALLSVVLDAAEPTMRALEPHVPARTYASILFGICDVFALIESGEGAPAQQLADRIDQAIGASGSFSAMVAKLLQSNK